MASHKNDFAQLPLYKTTFLSLTFPKFCTNSGNFLKSVLAGLGTPVMWSFWENSS